MEARIEEELKEYIHENGYRYEHFGIDRLTATNIRDMERKSFIAGAEFMQKDMQATLDEAEAEIILRGENFNKLKAQNEVMREALEKIAKDNRVTNMGLSYAREALERIKGE